MSDEDTKPATSKPPPRFPMRGPGRPYMIFAIVASALIAGTIIVAEIAAFFTPVDVGVLAVFIFGVPVWLVGHAGFMSAARESTAAKRQ